MQISIVAPVFNEEENLPAFYKRAKKTLLEISPSHEIIFVDDGSRDGSLALLKKIARKDKKVKIISFSRNFGHQAAITCGLDAAQGQAVVTIDTDLQDPPELILEMYKAWEKGAQIVFARRRARKDRFFKRVSARLFYRLIDSLSETDIPLDTGDFRLMDQRVVEAVRQMREHSRFIRGMASWVGFRQATVEFDRDKRIAGKTNYPFRKMWKLALDGIFSFSHKPLKVASWLGILTTVGGFVYAGFAIWEKLVHPDRVVQGWASLIVLILIMSGAQLIILGVIGEYLARVYTENQNRPLYIVSEKVNIK